MFDSLFGPLFDFNGDGKVTPDEEFLGFMIMQECLKSEQDDEENDDGDPFPPGTLDISDLPGTRTTDSTGSKEDFDDDPEDDEDEDDLEDDDGQWREEYYDNPVDIDPDNYGTLEEFLLVYEPVIDSMHEIFTDMVRHQLQKLNGHYDTRLAAAIVYLGSKDRITEKQSSYVLECLTKEVAQYGIGKAEILSAIEQLNAALADNDK